MFIRNCFYALLCYICVVLSSTGAPFQFKLESLMLRFEPLVTGVRAEADLSSCILHNQPLGLTPERFYELMGL